MASPNEAIPVPRSLPSFPALTILPSTSLSLSTSHSPLTTTLVVVVPMLLHADPTAVLSFATLFLLSVLPPISALPSTVSVGGVTVPLMQRKQGIAMTKEDGTVNSESMQRQITFIRAQVYLFRSLSLSRAKVNRRTCLVQQKIPKDNRGLPPQHWRSTRQNPRVRKQRYFVVRKRIIFSRRCHGSTISETTIRNPLQLQQRPPLGWRSQARNTSTRLHSLVRYGLVFPLRSLLSREQPP